MLKYSYKNAKPHSQSFGAARRLSPTSAL